MQVRKAVITAAGRGAPDHSGSDTVLKAMLPLVDRDGIVKPVIQIIAEEALDSGIEEICVITAPGDREFYSSHFRGMAAQLKGAGSARGQEQLRHLGELERRIRFTVQERPEGYGHAVWCAREFAGSEPFLLLVSDHVYISGEQRRCARQLIDLAVQQECAVAAVQSTREHLIHHYGTVSGKQVPNLPGVLQIETIIEKPTPSVAEQRLHVPGLRVGHYLCFFGMHVLPPAIFELLDEHVSRGRKEGVDIQLTPALQELARREKYLALQTNGRRYNIGVRFGSLEAQLGLALAGVDREEILGRMMELFLQELHGHEGETRR